MSGCRQHQMVGQADLRPGSARISISLTGDEGFRDRPPWSGPVGMLVN